MPSTPPGRATLSRAFLVRVVAILVTAAVVGLASLWFGRAPPISSGSLVGGPFALQDGEARTVTDQTMRGRPFLVYFGYTHCPDVCPTELARISEVLVKMGDKAIPALFITVDPERDTPKITQDYVSSFDSHIIGLSGSPRAIGEAEKAYRVFARKGPSEADGGYSMDHSSIVYLMDKTGAFVEALNLDRPPEETARDLRRFL